MQVNSAQDYLTMRKRQIVASTYSSTPPPQHLKFPSVYRMVVANGATQRQRFVLPSPGAWGSAPGTATFSNWCTTCEPYTGVFSTSNVKDSNILRRDIGLPMSVHAGIVG